MHPTAPQSFAWCALVEKGNERHCGLSHDHVSRAGFRCDKSETVNGGRGAGHLDVVAALLDHNPGQVNSRCEGSLPLHMVACLSALPARIHFSVEAAKVLLQHSASPFDRSVMSTKFQGFNDSVPTAIPLAVSALH